jgi:hypoxanthine phosphoribosyltransferase
VNLSTPALGETLVDAASIRARIAEVAGEIDAHYAAAELPLVLLCVLKGAMIFTADLARNLSIPVEIDFITVRSYGASTSSAGEVELVNGMTTQLHGRDVLIVEDIVDTGRTAAFLKQHLAELGATSVRLIAMLDKTSRRARQVRVEWSGFHIPDRFVVGYGLDHGERYRNLADVRALDVV